MRFWSKILIVFTISNYIDKRWNNNMMKDLKNWKDELLKETVWDHNGDILSTNEDEWICKFFNFKCTLREFFSPIFITFVSSNKKNNPK